MKKFLPIILIFTAFTLFGCGNSTSNNSSAGPIDNGTINVTDINVSPIYI